MSLFIFLFIYITAREQGQGSHRYICFPPEEGGVGMAAYEMACSLSSLDWDIHVLTRPLDSPDESFRSHQYSLLTTLPDTLTKDSARLREYLDGFLKDFRPDVIIYHSWADWCREELLDAARDSGIPFSSAPMVQLPISALFPLQLPSFLRPEKWLCSFFKYAGISSTYAGNHR